MPHSLEFLHAAYVPKSFNLHSLVEIQGILRNVTCCWSLAHKSAHQVKIFNRGTCAQGLVLLIFTWAGSPGPWPGSGASCWCARFNQTEIKVWSWPSWYWWQLCPRSNGSGIWAWRNLIFMRDGRAGGTSLRVYVCGLTERVLCHFLLCPQTSQGTCVLML